MLDKNTGLVRFDHDCDSLTEATQYMRNRGIQLLQDGYRVKNILPVTLNGAFNVNDSHTTFGFAGVEAIFEKDGKTFYSFYVLKSLRGKNVYSEYKRYPVVTVNDCEIVSYLDRKKIPYELTGQFQNNAAYKLISNIYGNTKAKRSGCFYMEHIDEGLCILNEIQASERAKEGFCLHPIFQDDKLFQAYWDKLVDKDGETVQSATILAAEYRNVANAYLSPMGRREAKDIALSPIKDVNDMLIADKVQNRKAFELVRGRYKNAVELDHYFKVWLERLGVPEERYQYLKDLITVKDFA